MRDLTSLDLDQDVRQWLDNTGQDRATLIDEHVAMGDALREVADIHESEVYLEPQISAVLTRCRTCKSGWPCDTIRRVSIALAIIDEES